jgi:hypothetical protein
MTITLLELIGILIGGSLYLHMMYTGIKNLKNKNTAEITLYGEFSSVCLVLTIIIVASILIPLLITFLNGITVFTF